MNFTENGTLSVFVTSAGGSIPIKGAVVRIKGASEENGDFDKSFITDLDGLVENVVLPTPAVLYSLSPNPEGTPFGLYDITVTASEYFKKDIYNAAVFSGVKATLPVNMIPLPVYDIEDVYPEGNLTTYIFEKLYSTEEL